MLTIEERCRLEEAHNILLEKHQQLDEIERDLKKLHKLAVSSIDEGKVHEEFLKIMEKYNWNIVIKLKTLVLLKKIRYHTFELILELYAKELGLDDS